VLVVLPADAAADDDPACCFHCRTRGSLHNRGRLHSMLAIMPGKLPTADATSSQLGDSLQQHVHILKQQQCTWWGGIVDG
jgi:hypothetical protein